MQHVAVGRFPRQLSLTGKKEKKKLLNIFHIYQLPEETVSEKADFMLPAYRSQYFVLTQPKVPWSASVVLQIQQQKS